MENNRARGPPSWRPVITETVAIPMLIFTGFGLITLGLIFLFLSLKVEEVTIRYDNVCDNSSVCDLPITIPHSIIGPVFIHYKLTHFYQADRLYIQSRNNAQLRGEYVDFEGMKECKYARSINESEHPDDWILPCGFMALSYFNDTFTWINTSVGDFTEEGISWESDRDYLFRELNPRYTTGHKWLKNGQTDEHFIVWMRGAAFPTFIKLYAKCEDCHLDPGTYILTIHNNYPVSNFGGTKSVVISTASPLGGSNNLMSVSYLVVGGLSVICGFVLLILRSTHSVSAQINVMHE